MSNLARASAVCSGSFMSARIRHCVQCPKCRTLYLVSASPYRNGSYLVRTPPSSLDEYTLYCACSVPAATSRWRSADMKACEVSRTAHRRGYGPPEEIVSQKAEPRPAGRSIWPTIWTSQQGSADVERSKCSITQLFTRLETLSSRPQRAKASAVEVPAVRWSANKVEALPITPNPFVRHILYQNG